MAESAATELARRATERLRLPPHSVEAEQSLLGGLMLDQRAWDQIADVVAAEDLYRADHRLIFGAVAALVERNQPPDAVTVSEHLQRLGQLEAAGGLPYLARLVEDTPSAANIRAYGRIVRDHAMLRRLIEIGGDIAASAHATEGLTAAEIVARYPQEHARFASRDPDYEVPGGESARAFTQRCLGCLAEIAGRHAGGEVVVVTHGLVLDSLYRAAHRLDHGVPRPVPLINASLNLFGYAGGGWRMELWGDVGHLSPGEVTQYRGAAA